MPHRLLLVEDDEAVRETLCDLLAFEDDLEVVDAVASAEAALATLAADPAIDLLITDVSLPGMSGLDLARKITAVEPHPPVLVLSGHQGRAYTEQGRQAGASGFVTKVDVVTELVPAIHRVLGP